MLTRKQKQEVIDKLAEKFAAAKSTVFADYKTLNVLQMKELRRKLKSIGAEFKVAKKTLFDLAIKKIKAEVSAKHMEGQVGAAFGFFDEVSVAKALNDFGKKNEGLKILGAIFGERFLDKAEAIALAKVPGKEQSLARMVGTLNAPLRNFVSVLQGNLRGLVYVLSQIKR